MASTDLDRLKSTLLTSGLQQTNNALFQVINQLIDYIRKLQIVTGVITTNPQIIQQIIISQSLELDGGSDSGGGDSLVVPGPVGPTGAGGSQGPMGPMGAIIFPPDAEDGQMFPPIVGPQGNPGITGASGPVGPMMVVEDGLQGEDGIGIPGKAGSDWDLILIKSADQTVTNNATLQNDTELIFSVAANSIYLVRFYIIYSGNNTTGDYKFDFLYGSSLTSVAQFYGWEQVLSVALGAANALGEISSASAWPSGAQSAGTDAAHTKFVATGEFRITTEAASTIQFRFANVSASAGRESTTRAGSVIKVKKLF